MAHAPCIFLDKDEEKISITVPALDKPHVTTVTWPHEIMLGVRFLTGMSGKIGGADEGEGTVGGKEARRMLA
jgi:hypothetical protein